MIIGILFVINFWMYLVVYVEDTVIIGSKEAGIKILKTFLGTCFQTKDLGPLKKNSGIEVSRN